MAAESLFRQYIDKWFKPVAKALVDTVNGTKTAPTYLFKTMLKKEYSPTMKWASISAKLTNVAADFVTMDSELPIKKRDSIERAQGDIPKAGMKLFKGERDLSDLDIMIAQGRPETEIVGKVFDDTKKSVTGVWEAMEDAFLRGISTGTALMADETRPGLGVRINYGIPEENFTKATITWDKANATPLSEIESRIDAASDKGDTLTVAMTSRKVVNNMLKSTEGKLMYAGYIGSIVTDPTKIALPSRKQFADAFDNKFGIKLIEVDRTIRYEKDGKQTIVRPFDEDNIVFLTSEQIGTLYYGKLAEETRPVPGVAYQKVDEYILVSKFSKNDPLEEATTSQAIAIPALDNVDSIYIHDTMEVTTK